MTLTELPAISVYETEPELSNLETKFKSHLNVLHISLPTEPKNKTPRDRSEASYQKTLERIWEKSSATTMKKITMNNLRFVTKIEKAAQRAATPSVEIM